MNATPQWPGLPPGSVLPPATLETLLRLEMGRPAPMARYWADPSRLMVDAGFTPDPWQAGFLRSNSSRLLLLCGRQMGKSTVAAALALLTAFLEAPALVLLLSP